MSTTKIGKKTFDLKNLKSKYDSNSKYKPWEYIDIGEPFVKACGRLPVMGGLNMFLGFSDTSKTTALILAAAWAQKNNILPVFCITEKKFSWDRAKLLGLDFELDEETGEKNGFFIYNDDFLYIEQVTDFINNLITEQEKGNIPYGMLFLWDSIGSVPCQMTYEGKGGKQHNASVLADKIGMGLAGRINESRKETKPYTNGMIIVNQPWVERPDNPMGQPKIKAKGGESLWFACSMVFLFGNQKGAGISFLEATKNKRKIKYATRTKVSVLKNHVEGGGFSDAKIIATPHGYIEDDKKAIDEYKKQYFSYFNNMFGDESESEIEFGNYELDFEEDSE